VAGRKRNPREASFPRLFGHWGSTSSSVFVRLPPSTWFQHDSPSRGPALQWRAGGGERVSIRGACKPQCKKRMYARGRRGEERPSVRHYRPAPAPTKIIQRADAFSPTSRMTGRRGVPKEGAIWVLRSEAENTNDGCCRLPDLSTRSLPPALVI
jgi:hypothetical protein